MFFVFAVAAVLLFILLPKRTFFDLRIRKTGVYLLLVPRILFGLVPIPLRMKAVYLNPYGFVLFSNASKPAVIGEKKPKLKIPIFKVIRIKSILVTGRVGFSEYPDLSAIFAGAVSIIIMQAAAFLFQIKPSVCIDPDFNGSSFAVNVRGIANVIPGKLVLEAIKSKRRMNNESSNRKHNAVVDGARKEAR